MDILEIFSNVKHIKSGLVPNGDNLADGEVAFGAISADNTYHIYMNDGGNIIDLLSGTTGSQTLDDVLRLGNTSNNSIWLYNDTNNASLTTEMLQIWTADINVTAFSRITNNEIASVGNDITVSMTPLSGFIDNGAPVLSANPDRILSDSDIAIFKAKLGIDIAFLNLEARVSQLETQLEGHINNIESHPNMNVFGDTVE